MPEDEQLLRDLEYLVAKLGDLFRIEETDASIPGRSPEVLDAVSSVA